MKSQWQFSQRYVDVPAGIDRPKWRTTLSYRFAPTFQAGLEYNAAVGEADPIANWYAIRETDSSPALILGTSSDRIGTPRGRQAVFLTASKQIGNLPIAPYVSLNYSGADRRFNYPFGAAIQIAEVWTLMPMYDGQRAHTTLTWSGKNLSISLLYIWNRRLGVSLGTYF